MTYLRDALTERVGEFIHLRRDIHQHPELAFEEHRTSDLVAAKLEAWGYAVHRGLGGTGVVGTLTRGSSSNKSHRSLGIRADMDALPIQETTGLAWASSKPGLMHAATHAHWRQRMRLTARSMTDSAHADVMPCLPCTTCRVRPWGTLCFAMGPPWRPVITPRFVFMARVAMAPCRTEPQILWSLPPR